MLVANAKIQLYSQPFGALLLTIGLYVAIAILHIDISSLIVLLVIYMRLFPLSMQIQENYFKTTIYLPSLDQTLRIMKETDEARERFATSGNTFTNLKEAIEIKNVSFSYNKGSEVLKNVSFSIPKNKTIALVGGSGAGKSTTSDLLLGLLQPAEGVILVDNIPLSQYNILEWRKHIAYVTQETILLHNTVKSNITWGIEDEIEESKLIEVSKLANAYSFIKEMKDGFDTIIGDRGVRMSGGQRQRLALARALARNPKLLILDEATSSLDAESELQVQSAIESLSDSMTILIIAHRLSTIRNADKIYVLESGQVVESGSYEGLMQSKGRFYELYNLQAVN